VPISKPICAIVVQRHKLICDVSKSGGTILFVFRTSVNIFLPFSSDAKLLCAAFLSGAQVVWQAALQKAIVLTFQNELTFKN
jgi:hypothetical protein